MSSTPTPHPAAPLKVLHLADGRSFTGPAAAALTDVRALLAAGHRAWLGSRSGGALEQGAAGLEVPFVGGFRLGRGLARLLRTSQDLRRLRDVIRELDLDVLHVHRSADQLLARAVLGRAVRPLLVRTWHRDPARLAALLRRKLAQSCGACACVSRVHAKTLRLAGAPRAEFLPAGVDAELFKPLGAPGAEQRGPARDPGARPLVLGVVGRWKSGEDRGQRAFLEIVRRLEPSLSWQGRLLGRGEGRAALEDLVAGHPARGRLVVLETSAAYPRQVAELDLGLVLASGSDGTSRAAVEMLACGVPILLADQPGLRELGEDLACAWVLPAEDHSAWAAELEGLLRDPAGLAVMQAAARKRALRVHALAIRGGRLAAFYAMGGKQN